MRLFSGGRMQRSEIKGGVETVNLESWNEFYSFIADEFSSAPAYVFRGQANADWKVESSLDRWERLHSRHASHDSSGRPPVSREVHLRAFRQAIRAIAPVQLTNDDDAQTWSLAQHHGLRTPLLDWSLSPFVALYFAFEHDVIHHDEDYLRPTHRAVFALSTSAIAQGQDNVDDERGIFPRVYSPSGPVSQRLLAQSSLFLMMPEQTDLESVIAEHLDELSAAEDRQAVLKKIRMPNEGRRDCLKMLNKMNINRLTLFPDLDGAARYINGLWDLDFDSALGYFEDADYAAEVKQNQ
jgi:hypothetical protein